MTEPDEPTGLAALGLARETVERYVLDGVLVEPPPELPPALRGAGGAFVSLHAAGRLRGCIGTLAPTRADLAHEIIAAALAAATHDPRFMPVGPPELPLLRYEVDLVEPPEPATGLAELDPRRYGLVVAGTGRRGVLLPDIAGIDTPEQQLAVALHKAGLPDDARVALYRFRVRRFVEPPRPGRPPTTPASRRA
jgi:AmmeMemoRadiSam system protein A